LNAQLQESGLISQEYREEQQRLHETTVYGTASIAYAPLVSNIVNRMGITHLLDYGCGANTNLAKHLKVEHKLTYQAYDPGVPRFSRDPLPAQMLASIDVLEHIEPDCLDTVLNHMASLAEGVVFLSVDCGPAMKTLSDGRNAHLIQQPMEWWLPKLMERWKLQTIQLNPVADGHDAFFVIGEAKVRLQATDGKALV
jgi:hypothetical protein